VSCFVDTLYISWRLPPLAAVFLQCSGRRRPADRQKESGGSENQSRRNLEIAREDTSALRRLFFFCRRPADCSFILYLYAIWKVCRFHKDLKNNERYRSTAHYF